MVVNFISIEFLKKYFVGQTKYVLVPKWATSVLESEAPHLSILFPLVKWETASLLPSMSRISRAA